MEIRVDQGHQPDEPLRLYAQPIKESNRDPRHRPTLRRLSFLMIVGVMKSFFQATLKVVGKLTNEGFISKKHWQAFASRVSA